MALPPLGRALVGISLGLALPPLGRALVGISLGLALPPLGRALGGISLCLDLLGLGLVREAGHITSYSTYVSQLLQKKIDIILNLKNVFARL